MTIYYIIALLSIGIMALPCNGQRTYRVHLFFCMTLLFCIGAFRYQWMDYDQYESIYNFYHNNALVEYDPEERTEYGYILLNLIMPSFRWLVIVQTLFTCITYFVFFDRYIPIKHRVLGIFLLYLCGQDTIFFMYSAMRNSFAIDLLLLSLPLVLKKKWIWYSAIGLVAFFFHKSSVIVFPLVYFMGQISTFSIRNSKILFGIAILLAIIPFSLFLNSATYFIINNLDIYESYVDFAEEVGTGASMLVKFSNILLCAFICFGLRNKSLTRTQVSICILALLCCYFMFLGPLNMRMSIYVGMFFIAGIILTYSKIENRLIRGAFISFTIVYKAYAFFIVFLGSEGGDMYQSLHSYLFDYITG